MTKARGPRPARNRINTISRPTGVRPTLGIQNTKNLMAEGVLNQRPRGQQSHADTLSHSGRTHSESVRYHARLLGGRQSSARATDQLNPDQSASRANKQGRRFPGL